MLPLMVHAPPVLEPLRLEPCTNPRRGRGGRRAQEGAEASSHVRSLRAASTVVRFAVSAQLYLSEGTRKGERGRGSGEHERAECEAGAGEARCLFVANS